MIARSSLKWVGSVGIVRHADTKYTGIFPDTTEIGISTTCQTGQMLKDQGIKADIWRSSPADRAKATAIILKDILEGGQGKTALIDPKTHIDSIHIDPLAGPMNMTGCDTKKVVAISTSLNERLAQESKGKLSFGESLDIAFARFLFHREARRAELPVESLASLEKRANSLLYSLLNMLTPSNPKTIMQITHFEIGHFLLQRAGVTEKTWKYLPRSGAIMIDVYNDGDNLQALVKTSMGMLNKPILIPKNDLAIQ